MLRDQPLDRPVPSYRKDLSVLTSVVINVNEEREK